MADDRGEHAYSQPDYHNGQVRFGPVEATTRGSQHSCTTFLQMEGIPRRVQGLEGRRRPAQPSFMSS